jgi:hypothetical protein
MRKLMPIVSLVFFLFPVDHSAARPAAGCIPWQVVPTPTDPSQFVMGIDGVAATDFWAVGGFTAVPPTILHWDGTAWTTPSVQNVIGGLYGVDVVSANDAWAVGTQGGNLVMHWDGTTWSVVSTPSPQGDSASLHGVSASSSSDVWAVGYTGSYVGWIIHWDGTRWSLVPSPTYPNGESFLSVYASAPDDAWAVGEGDPSNEKPIIIHWDGTSWQDVPLPKVSGGGLLHSVDGSGPNDIWAVGLRGTDGTLTFHWDGTTWSRKLLPYRYRGQLRAVSVLSPDDVWAAGLKGLTGPPIALHWNGSTWKDTAAVKENSWFNTIKAFDHPDVWAGGGGSAGIRVEQFIPCQ